jgi:hypothetical protein
MVNLHKISQMAVRKQLIILVTIIVVVGAGVYIYVQTRAASPFSSALAQNGVLHSGATKQPCSGASDGNCVTFNGSSTTSTPPPTPVSSNCADNPPKVSSDALYPLQQVMPLNGISLAADDFQDYGNEVQKPAGYVARTHVIPGIGGLVIDGYPDAISGTVGGVTGGSGDIGGSGNLVSTSGGFDICFSMSKGDWQHVHLVLISWPSNNVWADGENDFFEGNPQSMQINLHQIGPNPATNVYRGYWPSGLADGGIHLLSTRWDPTNGYRFYLDGTLAATAPVSATVATPTVPHHLVLQMQDTTESSTSIESATFYWMASYGYSG